MTDHPRQRLHYIITQYGLSVCDDAKRCEALLKDFCPQHKREVNLLMEALREGIAKELLKPNQLLPMETVISRLSQKLHDELGFEIGLAQWAVESWAFALGIKFKVAIAPSPVGADSPQTTHVNHAAALQQIKQQQVPNHASQVIIDQFKGWQKIGLQGEKLAVDAPNWAALIDKERQLMWAVNSSKTAGYPHPLMPISWKEAIDWVTHVNKRGWCNCHDWRLPRILELKSILASKKLDGLFLQKKLFYDVSVANYRVWSCSKYATDANYAKRIDFSIGLVGHDLYSSNHYIRLVRSVE
ncbi:MAG: DUF1566 domain-containing protein [Pseudomonadales bacterium]|nr:DUF1566 domain-containing protein [Pseudomonadales bacterium]MCB1673687.1 DUF1566 domain-containing protein [Pseudomonadales bacterium]